MKNVDAIIFSDKSCTETSPIIENQHLSVRTEEWVDDDERHNLAHAHALLMRFLYKITP